MGGKGGGGLGGELHALFRHPDVYASAPLVGDGRAPALEFFRKQVVGGTKVQYPQSSTDEQASQQAAGVFSSCSYKS